MKISIITLLYLLFTNIPEPGVLLHGNLRDDSCLFTAETQMTWTFMPMAGGDTLKVRALIKSKVAEQNLYSYRVLVPLATVIEGVPTPPNTLLVTDTPQQYIREIRVAGSKLVKRDAIYLSAKDRGTFRRLSMTW